MIIPSVPNVVVIGASAWPAFSLPLLQLPLMPRP
jgi:hypothetical protein